MMDKVKTLLFLSFTLVFCWALNTGEASAAAYYVSPSGSASWAQCVNINTPCSLSAANSNARAGDTINIRGGTYYEIIEPYNSGTPGKKITYTNYGNEKAIIKGEPGKGAVVAIGIGYYGPRGPDSYIVVEGLTIRHTDPASAVGSGSSYPYMRYPDLITVQSYSWEGGPSQFNEIRNNKIECQGKAVWSGGKEHGINVRGRNNLVEDNYIDGLCRLGIYTGGTARSITIRNNSVVNMYGNNINFSSSKGVMQNTLVEGNYLCGSLISDGIQFENDYDFSGVDYDSNRGVVIRNNIICDSKENAIDLKGAAYIVIEDNIIYQTEGNNDGGLNPSQGDIRYMGGQSIMHGTGPSSRDVVIRNNVIYDGPGGMYLESGYKVYNNVVVYNNRDYTGPNSNWNPTRKPAFAGIVAWSGKNNIDIKNNIIGGHNSTEIALGSNPQDLDINNNIYFNDAGAKFVDFRGNNDWNVLTFGAWKNYVNGLSGVKGADKDSWDADPLFVNVPADPVGSHDQFDFNLRQGSPGIDNGGFLTTTTGSGNGTTVSVVDTGYFFDGYGIVQGDIIQLEGQTQTAKITNISGNTITLDTSLAWTNNQGVSLAYNGPAPDIGAYEYGGITPSPVTCTSFTYAGWLPPICPVSKIQTRTVISSSPSGCAGGNPILTQSCAYIPSPTTTSLANSNTMTSNSQNFDLTVSPVENLWDGIMDVNRAGLQSGSAGAGNIASFWIEFDFGQDHDLTQAKLFGDDVGSWWSKDWTLKYKQNITDQWQTAFNKVNAFFNNWSTQNITGITARYVRVEVNGNSAKSATQVWELEIYGTPSTLPLIFPGDINKDGTVNVLDVQACVNHVLGIQDAGSGADVNGDGEVNVLDVQEIVNIILGG